MRLYLFASLGMFLALPWSGYSIVHRSTTDDAIAVTVDTGQGADGEVAGCLDRRVARLMEQPDEVVNALYRERLAQTLIVLTFGFALLTRVLFPRPHRRLFDHLVFAMHVHAAAIVAVRGAGALGDPLAAGYASRVLGLAFVVFLVVYLFRALRRFHGLGRLSTLWRFAGLAAVYLVALMVTLMATMILAVAFA